MNLLARIFQEMSPIETVAALLGVANVSLVAMRSIWNYAFGIVMVALYGWVFFEAKLYSDTLLQLFFLIVQVYGWWYWARGQAQVGEVRVERLTSRQRLAWIAGIALATLGWGWLMHRFTDASFPWWDATVAMTSVAAQILMSRRYWENWLLWILVDAVAVPLYAAKGLWITAALYTLFLGICVFGLIEWLRGERRTAAA